MIKKNLRNDDRLIDASFWLHNPSRGFIDPSLSVRKKYLYKVSETKKKPFEAICATETRLICRITVALTFFCEKHFYSEFVSLDDFAWLEQKIQQQLSTFLNYLLF
jgi:hypothetical protein